MEEKWTYLQKDRQTYLHDRQTDIPTRQTDKLTDRCSYRQRDRQAAYRVQQMHPHRQTDIVYNKTDRCRRTEKQVYPERYRHTDVCIHKDTDRHTDRQTERLITFPTN